MIGSCIECRFYVPRTDDQGKFYNPDGSICNTGKCRRNPPAVFMEGTKLRYDFVIVIGEWWCGEFRR